MSVMYNSLCVPTHPQWPCGSPQCITVSTELHSVCDARLVFLLFFFLFCFYTNSETWFTNGNKKTQSSCYTNLVFHTPAFGAAFL